MAVFCKSALELIGGTPMLELLRVHPGPGRILAKAEFLQPGGSVKDRAALRIIEEARASGILQPDQPVIEATSGNMGAGLAVVCNIYGHPFTAVMSRGNSPQRARMLEDLGAEVVLVDQVDGTPGHVTGTDIEAVQRRSRQLVVERSAFFPDQFHNPANVRAHETGTGPEIDAQAGEKLDAFVAAVGTAGSFVGVSRCLKRRRPRIHCVAVEAEGLQVIAGRPITKPRHLIQGTGYGRVPPLWEPGLADDFLAVSDDEAQRFRHELARREGLHVGYSSAANVCASVKLIETGRLGPNPVIATILNDTGLKY